MITTYDEIRSPRDLRNNQLQAEDRAFHDWYRFILSFPPQLVRTYLDQFALTTDDLVLDPFCGTGTTILEAKKNGIPAIGLEATPMSHFASVTKTSWAVDTDATRRLAQQLFEQCVDDVNSNNALRTLEAEQSKVLLKNSICPLPLHKCLTVLEKIDAAASPTAQTRLLKLALAHVAVHAASNLRFGPEVSVRRKKRTDADVFGIWLDRVQQMLGDVDRCSTTPSIPTDCYRGDSRAPEQYLEPNSIRAVITSPPYPNEKDYTRTTRLESVLLGFLSNKQDLRAIKETLLSSNSRNVYSGDSDDRWLSNQPKIQRLADEIERRRIDLGKTSGFECKYHRVTRLYFGGMARHLHQLKPFLQKGAHLAYVVGDQASFLQVMLRTGELLADIAHEQGYAVTDLDLFRTRLSSATQEQLREEVLVLTWQGEKKQISMMGQKAPLQDVSHDRFIEKLFFDSYQAGEKVVFLSEIGAVQAAKNLDIQAPRLGDVIYSYQYQRPLPTSITALLPCGEAWIIRSVGRGQYTLTRETVNEVKPHPQLVEAG